MLKELKKRFKKINKYILLTMQHYLQMSCSVCYLVGLYIFSSLHGTFYFSVKHSFLC